MKEDSNGSNLFTTLSEIDTAYAAGLYEGEGTVGSNKQGGWRVIISMTDEEPLARLKTTIGGRLRGPYPAVGLGHKPLYKWDLTKYDNVYRFYRAIEPYLSPRRISQFEKRLYRPAEAEFSQIDCGRRSSTGGYRKHLARGELSCVACSLLFAKWQHYNRSPNKKWELSDSIQWRYQTVIEDVWRLYEQFSVAS
jgi:hypothetical protein